MAKEEDAKDREKLPKIEAVVLGQVLRLCNTTLVYMRVEVDQLLISSTFEPLTPEGKRGSRSNLTGIIILSIFLEKNLEKSMRFLIIIYAFLMIGSAAIAAEPPKKKTVCLNMIVKNESQVIEKCLSSIKPLIDYWVIVDTGSNDNTKKIIKKSMQGIPGELHERPWVGFAHNRNEALALAKNKGDYVLIIDADEVLQFSDDFSFPSLEKDCYFIIVRQVGVADAKRNCLINNHLHWTWEGVLHEVISCPEAKSWEVLQGIRNLCNTNAPCASGRSKESEVAKYLRDAELLEKALKEEPNNSRYTYYLGVSYAAAGKYELAKKSFEKRIAMASSDIQETYAAVYNLGLLQTKLNEWDDALKNFFKAYDLRPKRAEPLFQIAKIFRGKKNVLLGYLLAKYALSIPYPVEDSCVEYMVYDHALLIEFANCALLLGKFQEGFDACSKLLANPSLPSEYKASVQSNYRLAVTQLQLSIPQTLRASENN